MEKIKQAIKHDPENNQHGNCYQHALAYLLGVDYRSVPHFYSYEELGPWPGTAEAVERVNERRRRWLAEKNLSSFCVGWPMDPDDVLDLMGESYPGLEYIMTARSIIADHCVVCRGGSIIYDPAMRNPSFIGRCKHDGMVTVEVVCPLAIRG